MRLITGADQECLGCVSLELTVGGGLLLGVRDSDRDRELLPWGLCMERSRSDTVVGREDCGMAGLGDHLGWGGA